MKCPRCGKFMEKIFNYTPAWIWYCNWCHSTVRTKLDGTEIGRRFWVIGGTWFRLDKLGTRLFKKRRRAIGYGLDLSILDNRRVDSAGCCRWWNRQRNYPRLHLLSRWGIRKERARAFFIEQEQKKQVEFIDHVGRLIDQFQLHAFPPPRDDEVWSPRPNQKVIGWARYRLFTFDKRKELLEHLRTGHEELYTWLVATVRNDRKNRKARQDIEDKIRTDIRTWACNHGLKNGNTREFPSYDEDFIVNRITKCLRREDPADLGDFVVVLGEHTRGKLKPDGSFDITSIKKYGGYSIAQVGNAQIQYAFCESEGWKTADDFVLFLNNIKNDSKLFQSMQDCIDSAKKILSDDAIFDQHFDDFINGKELKGVHLAGSCHLCPESHMEQYKPQTIQWFYEVKNFLESEWSG